MVDLRAQQVNYLVLLVLTELDRGEIPAQVSNEVGPEIQSGRMLLKR